MKRFMLLLLAIGLLNASCKKDEKTGNRPDPVVTSVSPARGRTGAVITINGENFSRIRKEYSVQVNGVDARIITFNEQNIYVEVPQSKVVGHVPVSITIAGHEAKGYDFEYMEPIREYVTSTFAGDGSSSFAEGVGIAAKFNNPEGVAVDSKGNILVADRSNHRIRKISPDGVVSTLAGNGVAGRVDGPVATARFNSPWKIAVDKNDNIIVADRSNHCIRKISADGIVSTIAGNGSSGNADGMGAVARFNWPHDVDIDEHGTIYVADYNNDRICKISPDGMVTTLAGSTPGYADGIGAQAKFNKPSGLVIGRDGSLLVADRQNNRIRKVTTGGEVSTLTGNDTKGSVDGDLLKASFAEPFGIAVDAAGNIFVSDLASHYIRKITVYGEVITLAGGGTPGFADGIPSVARFNQPTDVAVDLQGRVYVADLTNHRIRRLIQKED